jgi:hypothetical protein
MSREGQRRQEIRIPSLYAELTIFAKVAKVVQTYSHVIHN